MRNEVDHPLEPYVSFAARSAVPGVVPHQVNRLVIEAAEPFDAFRERYEQAAPQIELQDLAGDAVEPLRGPSFPWQATPDDAHQGVQMVGYRR